MSKKYQISFMIMNFSTSEPKSCPSITMAPNIQNFKRLTTLITHAVGRMLENQAATHRSEPHNTDDGGDFNKPSQDASKINSDFGPPPKQQLKKLFLAEKIQEKKTGPSLTALYSRFPDLTESVTPYIGIKARLSQVWINQYTIFLILIIIKIVLFQMSLKNSLETAEKYTMSSCKSSENMGSSAASMPHYMAIGANSLISKGLTSTRQGLIEMMILSITVLEQLLLFVINMLVGTYVCLLTVAVNTAANTAINATEAVINFVDNSLDSVVNGIEDGVEALQKAINTVSSAFNSIADAFTEDDSTSLIGNVSLSVSSLRNLSIPSSINSKLEELRSEIPDYSDVKNATSEAISIPFKYLKTELNDTLQSRNLAFNVSAIKIPDQQQITFCSTDSGIADFYDQLRQGVELLSKVFIIALAVTAILVCIPVAYREIKQWMWIKECAEDVQEIYEVRDENEKPLNPISNQRVDHIELIQTASHKWITQCQLLAAKHLGELTQKTLAKWWVEYVLYPPALMVLALGLCGIFMVILQFIIFNQVKDSLPAFEKGINTAASSALGNVQEGISMWANSTNMEIKNAQDDINENLLGWIHTATGSINDTLGVFTTTMNRELNNTFAGTPFYSGITGVVYCVIGSKIEMIQKGINWVHNNSQVALPTISEAYILPSALMNDTSNSSTESTTSESIDRLTDSAVSLMASSMRTLIELYEKSLYLELKISAILLGIWLFVALIGFLYCAFVLHKIRSNPSAKTLAPHHERYDSNCSEWFYDEKDRRSIPPARSNKLKSSYQYLKNKVTGAPDDSDVRISPPVPPRPAHLKPKDIYNTPNISNLSIDKEWQKYRQGNKSSLLAFRPPSILAWETGMTAVTHNGDDHFIPETPMTPTIPIQNNSPCQKPTIKQSPERKSLHATRGYIG